MRRTVVVAVAVLVGGLMGSPTSSGAQPPDERSSPEPVAVAPERAGAQAREPRGVVRGVLVNAAGEPMADEVVTLDFPHYYEGTTRRRRTNENGWFRFGRVWQEPGYSVCAQPKGFTLRCVRAPVHTPARPRKRVRLKVVRVSQVTARVVDRSGNPVEGVRVHLFGHHGPSPSGFGYQVARSNAKGRVLIRGLDAGLYRFRFHDPQGRVGLTYGTGQSTLKESTVLRVRASRRHDLGTIRMGRPAGMVATVTFSGRAEAVKVRAHPEGDEDYTGVRLVTVHKPEDGDQVEVPLLGLRPGQFTLELLWTSPRTEEGSGLFKPQWHDRVRRRSRATILQLAHESPQPVHIQMR